MPQAIQGLTLPPLPYQGNPQQQFSAAMASSSSGMGGDSIAPVLVGIGAVGTTLLAAAAAVLAMKHSSTSSDKPKPAQGTPPTSKPVERGQLSQSQREPTPEPTDETPLRQPQVQSIPGATKKRRPPQVTSLSSKSVKRSQMTQPRIKRTPVSSKKIPPPPAVLLHQPAQCSPRQVTPDSASVSDGTGSESDIAQTEGSGQLSALQKNGNDPNIAAVNEIKFRRFMDLPPELRGLIASFSSPGKLRINKALDDEFRPYMQSLKITNEKNPNLDTNLRAYLKNFKIQNSKDLNTVVRRFPHVKHLDLSYFFHFSDNAKYRVQTEFPTLSDADCEQIAKLTNLRYLNINWFLDRASTAGLKLLEALTNLEELHMLNNWNVTDAVLKHFRALTKLRHLNIEDCSQVTDAGLEHLKALTNLQHLNINSCWLVTDGGVAHLKALTNLQELDIQWCRRLTDASLEHLKALPNLRHLYINKHTGVTNEGIAEFRRERPQCQVHIVPSR